MIRFFADHPTAANLLMLLLIFIGITAVPALKRETFPNFTADEVQVKVIYPGASTEEVEEAICQRIEDAVDSVSNIEEIRSEALEGLGKVVIKLREGQDFSQFIDDIRTEVDAITNFPDEAEDPVVNVLGKTDKVVSIAITGPMSPSDLKFYAEAVKDRILLEPEISQVDISGFSDHQLRIELKAHVLKQLGFSISDIAKIISEQSLNLPAGNLETDERNILVRYQDERKSAQEFEDLIIVSGEKGGEIRLSDIATITDRFEDDENQTIFNGERAAILSITKTRAEDAIKVGKAVQRFVEEEQKLAPPGVNFKLTQDVFSVVKDRLQLLLTNGWQGFILVALTLWLFFSFKFGFWVVMGLPVSFLGTIFFMQLTGDSINMITMVGLLIALGLLMDDAIVIAENIATHFGKGKSGLESAIKGTEEVSIGVFSSYLTTICMFGPLIYLKGDIGKVLKVLPVILILTLSVSLVEAFCILPHHISHALGQKKPKFFLFRYVHEFIDKLRKGFSVFIDGIQEHVIGRLAELAISWRYLFIGIMIASFLCSVGMIAGGILKFRAFPDIDGDIIEARILLPQGTPLKQTKGVVKKVTDALEIVNKEFQPRQPEGSSLIANVQVQYNKNMDSHETGAHVATVSVDLLTAEKRDASIDEIVKRWREEVGEVPDVIHLNFKEPAFGPQGLAIEIRLQGTNIEELQAASFEFQKEMKRYKGVFDLFDDLRPGKPEARIRLKEGALALGFNAKMIASQLRSSYYGNTASEIQVGPESYEIDVRLALEDRNSLADLEYFTLNSSSGKQVPLNVVATIDMERGFNRIHRINSLRTLTIEGSVDSNILNVNEMIKDIQKDFLPKLKEKYPGIRVSFEGEYKKGNETGSSIRAAFLSGLVGVFILLSFQFRSYLEPFAVMIAIPFALIGVIWGHILMRLPLTMPSMVGFVSLAGIVVNDSILLVSFLKMRVDEGMSVHEAASQASRDRFRAVLLTSLTTIAGLIPLLSETSPQAQVLIPLVTSLVFGLAASTFLVLLVVPSLYAIFEDFGLTTLSNKKEAH